ncbi:hypothetical protein BDV59DRAFT_193496 [Aspergillus ambiguus]|uniref:uncharacterized protein n=1 Tax=Aspergillus ambiguus TaxID=176160 RepID=UPI003CCD34F8
MPDKRKTPGSISTSSPRAKRACSSLVEEEEDDAMSHTVTPYERPRNHPVYGQKSAFPGLDGVGDDELFYGPAEDGLEYLRMVRSEANSLPFLFTAPPTAPKTETSQPSDNTLVQDEKQDKREDARVMCEGVYADGVYVGPQDEMTATAHSLEGAYSDAQASYYNLLHHRFLLLRSILKCTPPSEAITALDDSHPISFPRHSKMARKEWRRLLLAVDPQTVQLACMDMDSVLGVLGIMARLISENVRSGSAERVRRMGAWAWGLLGKCRDVGQLGTEEVGEIRDLGKRAVKILCKMKEEETSKNQTVAQGEDPSDDESDYEPAPAHGDDGPNDEVAPERDLPMQDVEDTASGNELEQAKARLQAKLQGGEDENPPPADEAPMEAAAANDLIDVTTQTRAMLDMIITVVGEYFGQRDLLQTRELWEILPEDISPTSPPYTVYNITLRLPLRSFTVAKRYSDFASFHATLTNQTNAAPPVPLPSKSWFSNTVSNASLREERRQGLEAYLRAINDAGDSRWRNSPAWRAFLNLPSAATASANGNGSTISARLHAAITEPGNPAGTHSPITDPTLWLDCYRDMKSHLHDARLHLTRRDQETTPQKQHESSAKAKSSLVRAGSLISALDDGLKHLGDSSNGRTQSPSAAGRNGDGRRGGSSLGEGELRRRKDLVINARKEKDGLEDLLNAMAAKSRVDKAVASIQDKEALVGGAGRKSARSGRVLGKETERTRELDNQGVLQLQRQTMEEQDQSVEELMKIVNRQKELGIAINAELEIQNELLKLTDEDADRLQKKVDIGKKRIGKIS